ncbi:hypothetical protein E2493_06130 [Sphingomonas parva]|uniref:Uncharacterized protein n=1 Tax=Sphingomonas parva TaxID=2555898 RepID=A0A4Y8ZSW2_9SPHN|nr:hypothetical protein [Sphingomonas parva]TFI59101.1 hypothetical protein E2493_06130 [Sphingomonas parva]
MAAANIAPVIAAAAARARRALLAAFDEADAYAPERAIAYAPKRRLERRYAESLRAFGALHTGDDGRAWLERDCLREHTARRRRRAFGVIGISVAATGAILGFSHL